MLTSSFFPCHLSLSRSEFGSLLIYFYLCDRTNLFAESKKVFPILSSLSLLFLIAKVCCCLQLCMYYGILNFMKKITLCKMQNEEGLEIISLPASTYFIIPILVVGSGRIKVVSHGDHFLKKEKHSI